MALGKPVLTYLHDEAVRRTEEAFGVRVPLVPATKETLARTCGRWSSRRPSGGASAPRAAPTWSTCTTYAAWPSAWSTCTGGCPAAGVESGGSLREDRPVGAEYRFLTTWQVPGATPEEMYDVIGDATSYPRWWGDVFLQVTGDGRRRERATRHRSWPGASSPTSSGGS